MRHIHCAFDFILSSGKPVHVSELLLAPPEPDVGLFGWTIEDFKCAARLTTEESDELLILLLDTNFLDDVED